MKNTDKVYHLNLYAPFRPVPETFKQIYITQLVLLSIPCVIGVYFYGWQAVFKIALGIGCSLLWVFGYVRCQNPGILTVGGYWYYAVTGLLYVCLLPIVCPWYLVAGGIVAGHMGSLISRSFLRVSQINGAVLGSILVHWTLSESTADTTLNLLRKLPGLTWDGQTPQLDILLTRNLPVLGNLILKNPQATYIGMGSGFALIICGMYLLYRGYFSGRLVLWGSIVFLIGMSVLPVSAKEGRYINIPIVAQGLDVGLTWLGYQYFSGVLVFILFITSIDSLARPVTHSGQACYGILIGLFIVIIRNYTQLPVPDMTALILAQLCTPVIDKITRP